MSTIFKRAIRTQYQLQKLKIWINGKNFLLIEGKQKSILDSIDTEKKFVFLSTRQNLVHQLFSLLHECGHLMLRINNQRFIKKFPVLAKLENSEWKQKPLRYFVEELQEETLAWDKGIKLAKKLKIPLDIKKYNKYASKFLVSYMAFATIEKRWLI